MSQPPDTREATPPVPGEGGASRTVAHDPYAALRFGNYRYYIVGQIAALLGGQILSLTVGWELYLRTHSKLALGLVGLVQVVPVLAFFVPAGHVVDSFNRKKIVMTGTSLLMLTSLGMGLASLLRDGIPSWGVLAAANHGLGWLASIFGEDPKRFANPQVPLMYALLFINGTVRSVNQPARQSLLTELVPPGAFTNAVTWNSSIFELCSVLGPTFGGFLIAFMSHALTGGDAHPWACATSYFFCALLQVTQWVSMWPIKLAPRAGAREKLSMASLLAGIRFVKNTEVMLATMTLDLFAVLLGGATALLPVYANDILHVGAAGLGWLRAAPSIGAVVTALFQAHKGPLKAPGRTMLWAVVGFGLATIVFGVSTNFVLSMAVLILAGACDNVSVVVRHTLVQTLTPNAMRGRVSAVNSVFIVCSNELGAFESGTTAAMFGPVASVVGGGIGTLVVVGVVVWLWPALGKVETLKAAE